VARTSAGRGAAHHHRSGAQYDCNRTLANKWLDWLREMPRDTAIDLHGETYYDQIDRADLASYVCRGKAKTKATRFYYCATACVMHRDVRCTLTLVFVHPDNDFR